MGPPSQAARSPALKGGDILSYTETEHHRAYCNRIDDNVAVSLTFGFSRRAGNPTPQKRSDPLSTTCTGYTDDCNECALVTTRGKQFYEIL